MSSSTVLYDALGPRAKRRILVQSLIGGLVLLALAAFVISRLAAKGQLEGERWEPLTDATLQRRLLVDGLTATLKAAAVAMVLALALGAVLAAGRIARPRWLRSATAVWVEFFRGVPLLLLIFFAFLGGPKFHVTVTVFWAVVIGLTLYNSAVIAEIFRAGILSLPKGQSEAAYAVGLSRSQTLRLVLLPQAVRRMLPALVSQLVTLLKDTSLGFVVAYEELLRVGRLVVEYLGSAYSLPIYLELAVIYIAINATLSWFARWLDRRTQRRGVPTVLAPGLQVGDPGAAA
jgi:glutamate transport system permease protein